MATDPLEFYKAVANVPQGLTEVALIDYVPLITVDDINKGFVNRYFVRQANHSTGFITEISYEDYLNLKDNHLYTSLELQWRISGPLDDVPGPQQVNTPTRLVTGVITANRLALEAADKILPGMKLRLRNLAAYHQFG